MSKKFLRMSSLVLSVALASSLLYGCGKTKEKESTPSSTPAATASNGAVYPLKTDVTLTYWMPTTPNISSKYSNIGDIPYAKEKSAKTGIKVKYINPGIGTEKDQFNIMIASGDIPDIIQYSIIHVYPGGVAGAAKNSLIIPLNDVLPKSSPALVKRLSQDKELDKMIKTDDNKYYFYPQIRDEMGMVWAGPILRSDWMKELNLKTPETMEDWYDVLKTFKEKKGATAALSFTGKGGINLRDAFVGAYKTSMGFFVDDSGKVKFGPNTPEYKEFMTTFAKWYKDGLIDKDFPLTDDTKLKELIDNNKTGAWVGNAGGSIRSLLDKYKDKNPSFDMIGVKYPVLKKGETPFLGQSDFKFFPGYEAVITTKCKNVDIAARFLDYNYTTEGNALANFGLENTTYKLENGTPKFTDFVFNNPDKMTSQLVQELYSLFNGPFASDKRRTEQGFIYKQQTEAVNAWKQTDALKHIYPTVSFLDDESTELRKTQTDLETYVLNMFTKFVIGQEPLDNFGKYQDELKKLGIEKQTQIRQAAYDRYLKR